MFISDFTYIRRVGVSYCYMIFLTFMIGSGNLPVFYFTIVLQIIEYQ